MKKLFFIIFFVFCISTNAHALNLSRVKTWNANDILTASDLNAEFNNILNHSLTNNDIGASAGILASKIDFTISSAIGSTTPSTGAFTTLSASSTLGVTGAATFTSTGIFKDKLSFTQTDNNEYIDSLADGYLDFEATTGLRFRINSTEQINLVDGVLAPTTDNDIDLGASDKEYKDLHIDGTANIDSLVADTADINGGTVNGLSSFGMPTVTDIDDILDEDDMSSNSATALATQQSIKAYADTKVMLQSSYSSAEQSAAAGTYPSYANTLTDDNLHFYFKTGMTTLSVQWQGKDGGEAGLDYQRVSVLNALTGAGVGVSTTVKTITSSYVTYTDSIDISGITNGTFCKVLIEGATTDTANNHYAKLFSIVAY